MDRRPSEPTLEEVIAHGMPAGTLWAGPGASPEAIAAAGLPATFFEDMAREQAPGVSHRMGVIHANRAYCDDLACQWCRSHRERAETRASQGLLARIEAAGSRPTRQASDAPGAQAVARSSLRAGASRANRRARQLPALTMERTHETPEDIARGVPLTLLREIVTLVYPTEQRGGRRYYTGGYFRLLVIAIYVLVIASILGIVR
jgi:hypothetical protein